jgi:aryl-phospho-beta-D-glucosidase BglC (GH1 family)
MGPGTNSPPTPTVTGVTVSPLTANVAKGTTQTFFATVIERYYSKFVSKGIPVIIGEFGAMNKNNEAVRAQWAEYYISYARSRGIKCFWWDNGVTTGDGELFGLLNRQNNTFTYNALLNGMMSGAGGAGPTSPTPPTTPYGGENVNDLGIVSANIQQ